MSRQLVASLVAIVAMGAAVAAEDARIPSPRGMAATEVRGRYTGGPDPEYVGGKWIEIDFGRPIKRGRDLWGSGAGYGRQLNAGAPVWRAGADMSTRLKTELPLVVNGTTVPAGEYSLFIDLKPAAWTLIVSRWGAMKDESALARDALWGSFEYTSDKDVVRAPMKLESLPHSVDQLTWEFLDVSDAGGALAIEWDRMLASVPFRIGR